MMNFTSLTEMSQIFVTNNHTDIRFYGFKTLLCDDDSTYVINQITNFIGI